MGKKISILLVLGWFLATLVADLCLRWLGDWEHYEWPLWLAMHIIWGVWIIVLLATILTHVTIFGWSFRRYFRWPEPGQPPPQVVQRPTRAPWMKSGKVSFSFTVSIVAVTGAVGLATAILFMLVPVIGTWAFWLVSFIMWGLWWIAAITLVLVRVTLFDLERKQARTTPPADVKNSPSAVGTSEKHP